MSPRRPLPWHVRWASRVLSERERTELIAELADMYDRRLRRSGRPAADAWLRREGRRAFVHLFRFRLGSKLPNPPTGWKAVVAKLGRKRAAELLNLADRLEREA